MVLTALRNLLAHKIRLFTTGLAVMLGVAFMAGTLVLTDTVTKTFDDLFSDALAGTDAMVRAEASFDDPNGFGEMRGRIDEALLTDVEGVDGVALASGDVWGFAQVVGEDGEPIGNPGAGAPTIGTNWPEGDLNTWTLVEGEPPRTDTDVVMDKAVADDAGYAVGDRATVLVQGAPLEVDLTGIARIAGADSPGGATFTMFTTEAAQRYVGEAGKFDSISVAARTRCARGCRSSARSCSCSPSWPCWSAGSSSSTRSSSPWPSAPARTPCCGPSARPGGRSSPQC